MGSALRFPIGIVMPDGSFKSTTIVSIALLFFHGFEMLPVVGYASTERKKLREPMFFVNCRPVVLVAGDVVFEYGEAYSSLMSVWNYCLQFVPSDRLPLFKHNLFKHISAVERYEKDYSVQEVWNGLPNGMLNLNKMIGLHNLRTFMDVDRAVNFVLYCLHIINCSSVHNINK